MLQFFFCDSSPNSACLALARFVFFLLLNSRRNPLRVSLLSSSNRSNVLKSVAVRRYCAQLREPATLQRCQSRVTIKLTRVGHNFRSRFWVSLSTISARSLKAKLFLTALSCRFGRTRPVRDVDNLPPFSQLQKDFDYCESVLSTSC